MLIHNLWKLKVNEANKSFCSFIESEDFFKVVNQLDKKSRLVIDSNLGKEIKGKIIGKDPSQLF